MSQAWGDKVGFKTPDISLVELLTNSWLVSYWAYIKHARAVTKDVYMTGQHEVVVKCLQKANVLLAYDLENPEFFYGWICYESTRLLKTRDTVPEFVLHYIYVKKSFRRCGIGRELVSRAGWARGTPMRCTHWGWRGRGIGLKFNATFDPFTLVRT
jgi:hypothetical protein